MTVLNSMTKTDPSAETILDRVDLTGKRALITGATSGIGQYTAMALAKRGVELIIPARDQGRAKATQNAIAEHAEGTPVDIVEIDLTDLESVRAACEAIKSRWDRIDILINNAAIMAAPLERTASGVEMQFQVNYLSAFLLTNLLLPLVPHNAGARIVNLSSVGHRRCELDLSDPFFERSDYDKWIAYSHSKTAAALFTVALQKRLGAVGIDCFAVNPGDVLTNIARNLTQAEIDDFLEQVAQSEDDNMRMKTPSQAAASVCYAATSPDISGKGGQYIENCAIAEIDNQSDWQGVKSYALDSSRAEALWSFSERWADQSFGGKE